MSDDSPTRDAILDAAERLFAAQGFAATTTKHIGTEASVNSALLYYYFKDKEELYHAVLGRLVDALVESGQRRLSATTEPPDLIRHFVTGQAEFLIGHPNFPRLLVRELLDHDAANARAEIARISAGLFARLTEVIASGQSAGLFRVDVEPRLAAVSIVSQLAYLVIARPAVGLLIGGRPDAVDAAFIGRFADHVADFCVAALATPAVATPA